MKATRLLTFFVCGVAAMFLLSATSQAQTFVYDAFLSGPNESPANASPGTGFAEVSVDLTSHLMTVHVDFTGLTGTTTASHVHAPTTLPGSGTAGVATQTPTFTGFPLGVTSGTYDHIFDMTLDSTWNPAYESANGGTAATAELAFEQALADGKAYLNIHSQTFPGGEIRGFLLPVPEPGIAGLIITGGVGLWFAWRKRLVR